MLDFVNYLSHCWSPEKCQEHPMGESTFCLPQKKGKVDLPYLADCSPAFLSTSSTHAWQKLFSRLFRVCLLNKVLAPLVRKPRWKCTKEGSYGPLDTSWSLYFESVQDVGGGGSGGGGGGSERISAVWDTSCWLASKSWGWRNTIMQGLRDDQLRVNHRW